MQTETKSQPEPINDGGPAFPQFTRTPLPYGASHVEVAGGMSLRDWFAGRALSNDQAMLVSVESDFAQLIARRCYAIADAMLAERAKEGL